MAKIVKNYAEQAGLDPSLFSGPSLRAGFITAALQNGADVLSIIAVTRHQNVQTLKGYDSRAKAFSNHAGKRFL